MSKGYQCDNCSNFTKKPVKIQYPATDKKLDYLGIEVSETDMQDDEPGQEHYCKNCIKQMKQTLEEDQNEDKNNQKHYTKTDKTNHQRNKPCSKNTKGYKMTELLVFGVDGLSNKVIQMLGKERLPTLHKLQRQTDTYGDYESYTVDGYQVPHTGPMWTSIYTGLYPEQHGLTEGGWREGESIFHEINTVWDKLSQETDKQIALYGMPMTYRAKPIQGWMVSGFVHTTLKSMYDNCLYPENLLDNDFIENTAAYRAKVKLEEGCHPDMPEEPENAIEILREGEENRLETFKNLVEEKGTPDIAAYGTTFADKVGHIDTINPANQTTINAYKYIDQMLKQLLETLEPEEIVIISDHGFSGWSHDELGYYLDTTGEGMQTVFDFTPWLLNHFDIEYKGGEYGKQGELEGLSDEEKDQMTNQLADLGYIDKD